MAVRKNAEVGQVSYTARPKYAKKPKLSWTGHVRNRAREGFEIEGITNEIPFFDYDDDFDAGDGCNPEDAIVAQLDGEGVGEEEHEAPRELHLKLLQSAMDGLSDKARLAVYLYGRGLSQHEAADFMGNAQTSYREIIVGKDGKGGAIRKLRDILGAYPITLTKVKG